MKKNEIRHKKNDLDLSQPNRKKYRFAPLKDCNRVLFFRLNKIGSYEFV